MKHGRIENDRRSIRLPGYDYTQTGAYFITICTAERQCLFGGVNHKERSLRPSPIGELVIDCWESIPDHFPDVELDEFVFMPNHFHGILIIAGQQKHGRRSPIYLRNAEAFGKPVQRSIPTIVRSFKSAVSRRNANEGVGASRPIWQRNYYERVIRTENELDEIRMYISENPAQWSEDPENPAVMKNSLAP